ncbi:glycosyl transferase 2 family protein [Francisella philomiragia]|uniref:glycosyltransferase n=1 Tax=Francisella philomiragia TaxID=28110 RepID=UPI0005A56B40|nr:glycosyltransferase [Francisella philomiragia]AJI56714.1 glycosyl transferase 2 family protein [Francisella philomiragia]
MINTPLITVITICFNTNNLIGETILSVANQTYENIEHIIIDMVFDKDFKSNISKLYAENVSKWLHADSDSMLVDLLNQTVQDSFGEVVTFLEAGDVFADNDVLQNISKINIDNADIIYGNFYHKNFSNDKIIGNIKNIHSIQTVVPQSSFIKKEVFTKHKLNIKDIRAQFYDFFLNCHKIGLCFLHINTVISKISALCYDEFEEIIYKLSILSYYVSTTKLYQSSYFKRLEEDYSFYNAQDLKKKYKLRKSELDNLRKTNIYKLTMLLQSPAVLLKKIFRIT